MKLSPQYKRLNEAPPEYEKYMYLKGYEPMDVLMALREKMFASIYEEDDEEETELIITTDE